MDKKIYKLMFVLGIIAFITGVALIFFFNKVYAIGLVSLGAMWSIMGFGNLFINRKPKTEDSK